MSQELLHTLYLAFAYLVLFGSAELMYHKFNVKAELTRKFVHLVTGLLTLLFPPLIGNHWLVLFLCASFLVILLISLYFKKLPSINAVDRITRGSILYPIIVYCCYLVYIECNQYVFYYAPILILAICDPIAALVGKKWPIGKYVTFGNTKTWSGSLSFFTSSVILLSLMLHFWVDVSFIESIIIVVSVSTITTFAEAITHRGYDNLTIPFSALVVLVAFTEYFFV